MKITTRPFEAADLEQCLNIERSAVSSNHYLKDVVDYYNATTGELTVALADDQPVGVGKLTVLFDGSAWLELLRVHPDFQRQGVGTAIYDRYFQQVNERGCPAVRMYTGVNNVASAGLAEKYGIHRGPAFHGMTLELDQADAALFWEPPVYHRLSAEEAVEALMPLKDTVGGFLCINHTFYEVDPENCRGFAAQGWVYGDGAGSALVMGARFQPDKALYIAAATGDRRRALSFALNMAVLTGVSKMTAHFPQGNGELEEFYKKHGFQADRSDDVVMEWVR